MPTVGRPPIRPRTRRDTWAYPIRMWVSTAGWAASSSAGSTAPVTPPIVSETCRPPSAAAASNEYATAGRKSPMRWSPVTPADVFADGA
jgi:hypothetical protein